MAIDLSLILGFIEGLLQGANFHRDAEKREAYPLEGHWASESKIASSQPLPNQRLGEVRCTEDRPDKSGHCD